MAIEQVPIADIVPNPLLKWRTYPFDKSKIARLVASIRDTELGTPLKGRRVGGKVELASGHHRLEALKELNCESAKVDIEDYADEEMVRIYAEHNVPDWSPSLAQQITAVETARRLLQNALDACETWEDATCNKIIIRAYPKRKRFINAKAAKNVGYPAVTRYLNGPHAEGAGKKGRYSKTKVSQLLRLVADDISLEAVEKFKLLAHADTFREMVQKHKVFSVEEQPAIVENILNARRGRKLTRRFIREFIMELVKRRLADRNPPGDPAKSNRKINRGYLLSILGELKPGLQSSKMIEQCDHFLFLGNCIVTYNGETCHAYFIDTGIECSVPGPYFYNALENRFRDTEISLALEEPYLFIDGEDKHLPVRAKTDFYPDNPDIQYPFWLQEGGHEHLEWEKINHNMKEGLVVCSKIATDDMERRELTGVYLVGNQIMASDKQRLVVYGLQPSFSRSALIPALHLGLLDRNIYVDYTEYCVSGGWIHFQGENRYLGIKLIEGYDYPSDAILQLIPEDEPDLDGFALPARITKVVSDSLQMFPEEEAHDAEVTISINDEKATCFIYNASRGVDYEEVPVPGIGVSGISFRVDPVLIKDVMKDSEMAVVNDGNYLMLSDENIRYLVPIEPG